MAGELAGTFPELSCILPELTASAQWVDRFE